jgi:hypothetical protein
MRLAISRWWPYVPGNISPRYMAQWTWPTSGIILQNFDRVQDQSGFKGGATYWYLHKLNTFKMPWNSSWDLYLPRNV